MSGIEEDMGAMHALLTEHIAAITLSMYRNNNITINMDEILKTVSEIQKAHFDGKSVTDSILIAQMLLQGLYQHIQEQANVCKEENNCKEQKKLKEFLTMYS